MTKLAFVGCALAAASCAYGYGYDDKPYGDSLLTRYFQLHDYSTYAVSNLSDSVSGFVTLEKKQNTDVAYNFKMTLKLAGRSADEPKLSDFVEALPSGVHYYESQKKTIQGLVWAKARPCWLIQALLNSEYMKNRGSYASSLASYASILPDVRSVSLWDSKARKYIEGSLFYFGAYGMGSASKEALGLFISAFGADSEDLAEDWYHLVERSRHSYSYYGVSSVLNYLKGETGIALGFGIGRTKFSKDSRYVQSLDGNCLYMAVNVDSLGSTYNAFYDIYSGDALVVPYVELALGYGSWQLKVNTSATKKLAKQATEDDKLVAFKAACTKSSYGDLKTADQRKIFIAAAVSGAGPTATRDAIAQSDLIVLNMMNEYSDDAGFMAKAQTLRDFYAMLTDLCNEALAMGIEDPEIVAPEYD